MNSGLPDVDVVYVAVPHHLHEKIYLDVLKAGKDLLAEKPFGIDLKAARAIAHAAKSSGRFVRCSSEFPFFPGRSVSINGRAGRVGTLLEIRSGFHHSSDLDPTKPANWKRQVKTCGEIGVMGDLGMHAVHLPFRLGWQPTASTHSCKKSITSGRTEKAAWPRATHGTTPCSTPTFGRGNEVPMRLEMKRLAPGETNTWFIEIFGTEGGVRFSTKEPKTL